MRIREIFRKNLASKLLAASLIFTTLTQPRDVLARVIPIYRGTKLTESDTDAREILRTGMQSEKLSYQPNSQNSVPVQQKPINAPTSDGNRLITEGGNAEEAVSSSEPKTASTTESAYLPQSKIKYIEVCRAANCEFEPVQIIGSETAARTHMQLREGATLENKAYSDNRNQQSGDLTVKLKLGEYATPLMPGAERYANSLEDSPKYQGFDSNGHFLTVQVDERTGRFFKENENGKKIMIKTETGKAVYQSYLRLMAEKQKNPNVYRPKEFDEIMPASDKIFGYDGGSAFNQPGINSKVRDKARAVANEFVQKNLKTPIKSGKFYEYEQWDNHDHVAAIANSIFTAPWTFAKLLFSPLG